MQEEAHLAILRKTLVGATVTYGFSTGETDGSSTKFCSPTTTSPDIV